MTDPRKIRIRYEIDVTLDQSEYTDQALSVFLESSKWDAYDLIKRWNLRPNATLQIKVLDE